MFSIQKETPRLRELPCRQKARLALNFDGTTAFPGVRSIHDSGDDCGLENHFRREASISSAVIFPSLLLSHVCNAWFGHSETIFREHYAQVTEEHFNAARRRTAATPQITSQQTSEMPGNGGTTKIEDFEPDAQSPLESADNGEWPKSEEIEGMPKWAIQDSNL